MVLNLFKSARMQSSSENGKEPAPTGAPAPVGIWRYLPSGRVMLCAASIILSFVAYGYIQERIMTKPYFTGSEETGDPGGRFGSSLALVLANRLAAAFLAMCIILVKGDMSELRNKARLYQYVMISVRNFFATRCQYEAL